MLPSPADPTRHWRAFAIAPDEVPKAVRVTRTAGDAVARGAIGLAFLLVRWAVFLGLVSVFLGWAALVEGLHATATMLVNRGRLDLSIPSVLIAVFAVGTVWQVVRLIWGAADAFRIRGAVKLGPGITVTRSHPAAGLPAGTWGFDAVTAVLHTTSGAADDAPLATRVDLVIGASDVEVPVLFRRSRAPAHDLQGAWARHLDVPQKSRDDGAK